MLKHIRIITTGEPAGIGPEIIIKSLIQLPDSAYVVVGDPELLQQTAHTLGVSFSFTLIDDLQEVLGPGNYVLPVTLTNASSPGMLDVANAPYVLTCLQQAAQLCLTHGHCSLVTAPLHKGIINQSGIPFTGHTEFLANHGAAAQTVMMLANHKMRVALATTHVPLKEVSGLLTQKRLTQIITITHLALQERFGIAKPTICVAGLNPHAGEDGYLGMEEQQVITPVIEALRAKGMNIEGPIAADTIFLKKADVYLMMYHDQGLGVIKYSDFHNTVNLTLGLPYLRSSPDHGVALDIAGKGIANPGSFIASLKAVSNQRLC